MHCRLIAITIILSIAAYSAAQADDAPEKTFIPFSMSNRNIPMSSVSHTQAPLPRFLPLGGRFSGKVMPHSANAVAKNDDIPVAHEGPPEAMTHEQAIQILSLFGSNE